jgi:hypothetical protein
VNITAADRRASRDEVIAHAGAIRAAALDAGAADIRIGSDGTLVIRATDDGYRQVVEVASRASGIVGVYVHTIPDSVETSPAAQRDRSRTARLCGRDATSDPR